MVPPPCRPSSLPEQTAIGGCQPGVPKIAVGLAGFLLFVGSPGTPCVRMEKADSFQVGEGGDGLRGGWGGPPEIAWPERSLRKHTQPQIGHRDHQDMPERVSGGPGHPKARGRGPVSLNAPLKFGY